jgi:hypothetical protein
MKDKGLDIAEIEAWADKDERERAKVVTGNPPQLRRDVLEYLQVEYQVLNTLDRKPAKYDQDKVDALEKIAARIRPAATGADAEVLISDLPIKDPKIRGALWNKLGQPTVSKG